MPLQLGGTETQRPQTIVWDTTNPNESFEAGQRVAELIKQGFIKDFDNVKMGSVTLMPPKRDPNKGIFRILSDNGDDRIVWDRRSGSEVKDAFKKFNDLLSHGYSAYAVNATGQRGHKIDTFDPALEEIVMVPGTMPG